MQLEHPIVPRHQEDCTLLWQQEMHGRGLRMGRNKVRLLQRDRRQMRALPHHPVVLPPNSARQPPQPLHDPIQGMLVDQMGGQPFDAVVEGLLCPAQVRLYDGGIQNV